MPTTRASYAKQSEAQREDIGISRSNSQARTSSPSAAGRSKPELRWERHTLLRRSHPATSPRSSPGRFPQITHGRLQIAGHDLTVDADAAATHCTLTIELKEPGRTTLKAWFTNEAGDGQCGAFFVTVRRKSEVR